MQSEACSQVVGEQPTERKRMDSCRYVDLINLAIKINNLMDNEKVTQSEGCVLRRIIESMFYR